MNEDELLTKIEQIHSELEGNPRIHTRAREDIHKFLNEGLKAINERETNSSLNEAASKVNMAKARMMQADDQKRWLAFPILIWMIIFIALGGWGIFQGEYWPKATDALASEILFGAVLWGVVGASIDGLRELHTRLARQELDTNRLTWYLVHPLIGAGLGGILYLVVSAGLLMTEQQASEFNPSLPLILAALAGFEQQTVIQYLRDIFSQILRVEGKNPNEGG